MKLSKLILCLPVLLLLSIGSFAQREKVDSLKKVLQSLHDTSKVDCLNELSYQYVLAERKDSATYFSNLAYKEAKKMNYIHGIAISYSRQSQIAKHFDDDFAQSEIFARESLQWFQKTRNKKGLNELYFYLIFNFVAQSKFDEGIYYGNEFYKWANKQGDISLVLESTSWLIDLYRSRGDFEKSFFYAQILHELAIGAKNKVWISSSLYKLAQLYQLIENYQEALSYFRKVISMDDSDIVQDRIRTDNDIWFKMEFAETFWHLNQFDSAWHYYNLYNPGEVSIYYRVYLVSTGECYLLQKNYPQALQNLLQGLDLHKKLNDRNEIMRTQLDVAKAYLFQGNYTAALSYAREGLAIALQTRTRHIIRDGYQISYAAYDNMHENDSAYLYYRRHISLKDSVLNDQIKGKFAAYNYEKKIESINKEKEIQQVRLQNEMFTKKVLVGGVLCLLVSGTILFRNTILKRRNEKQRLEHELEMQKLESEKARVALQQQATELEMQALRAQMNPHFIFNSLNSINRFILQNNKAQASVYLTKFSKLVRMILQNSQASLITLESELESLELYLDLEALRFNYQFAYRISVPKDMDIEVLKVPPLIIQPYAENAIWHGLMHKEEKGLLDIEISQDGDYLFVKITDDGIGRKHAAELASKSATRHKSMGLKITADRIAMLHRLNESESPVTTNDLVHPDGRPRGNRSDY